MQNEFSGRTSKTTIEIWSRKKLYDDLQRAIKPLENCQIDEIARLDALERKQRGLQL